MPWTDKTCFACLWRCLNLTETKDKVDDKRWQTMTNVWLTTRCFRFDAVFHVWSCLFHRFPLLRKGLSTTDRKVGKTCFAKCLKKVDFEDQDESSKSRWPQFCCWKVTWLMRVNTKLGRYVESVAYCAASSTCHKPHQPNQSKKKKEPGSPPQRHWAE